MHHPTIRRPAAAAPLVLAPIAVTACGEDGVDTRADELTTPEVMTGDELMIDDSMAEDEAMTDDSMAEDRK